MKVCLAFLVLLLTCHVCAARTRVTTPNYVGFFDEGDCNTITGWAADRNRPNVPLNVTVVFDSTESQTVFANLSRPDVAPVLGDNGLHGFFIPFPTAFKNGTAHTVEVRFETSTIELTNSPKTVTCPPAAFVVPNPEITSFKIQSDSSKTTTDPNLSLSVEFSRAPSFYRLGEIHDINNPEQELKNLQWQPYTAGMSFTFHLSTAAPYGTRYVFMQVNRNTSESSASAPKGDGVVLAPAHTKTFTLTGQSLKTFLDRAKALGYRFTLTGPSITGNFPCPGATTPNAQLGKGTDYFETWTGKIFDKSGPDRELLPFWKLTEIRIGDLFSPADPSDVKVSGPPSGEAETDLLRNITFKRGFAVPASSAFDCAPGTPTPPDATSVITSITLTGPDDKTPEDALFPPPFVLPKLIRPNVKLLPIPH